MKKRALTMVNVLLALTLLASVFLVSNTRFVRSLGVLGLWGYDPWWDVNNDGRIDIADLARVSGAFGTFGTNITKASLEYDTGWVDLNELAQWYNVTHGLNSTNIVVDARGCSPGLNKTYSGCPAYDNAYVIIQTLDGGYALAGDSLVDGMHCDAWLVKVDVLGNIEWDRKFGDWNDDHANWLVQTSDGGYAIAGAFASPGINNYDFWLIKTNSTGNMEWSKTYGGSVQDGAMSLCQTNDGGYILAGHTMSFGNGGKDFWLVKTNSSGNMVWNKTFGGSNDEVGQSVIQTQDGGYALLGQTFVSSGNWDQWLIKVNATGNEEWNKTYGGSQEEFGNRLIQTPDNGYALGGFTYSYGAGYSDFWLVKTNSTGYAQWSRTYGDGDYDDALDLCMTDDGGYILAGQTGGSLPASKDAWIVRTNSTGHIQWNKTYGGALNDALECVIQAGDGYALVGNSESFGTPGGNFWLLKTNAEGEVADTEIGLAWTHLSTESVKVYLDNPRGHWSYIRVCIWKIKDFTP